MTGVVSAGDGRLRPNLPLRLTSFVARAVELAELRRLLREFRLVTLTGPGGAGKTRLALETTAAVAAEFDGRAFLVDLAALTRSDLLLDTVARAFPMENAAARPALDALADYLCDHPALLILDNCEHLLAACAELAASLLAACPMLTVLATSQVAPEGATGMDTQVTAVRKLLNRRADSTVEICEFIPNQRESFRTVAGSPVVSGSLAYEPSGAGTLVTQRLEFQPGTFFSLPQGVVAGALRRNIAAGLAEAKDLRERAARGPG